MWNVSCHRRPNKNKMMGIKYREPALKKEKASPFQSECIQFIQHLYREQSEMTVPVCQLLTMNKKS